jgi:nucleoside-diphosphate-sugar epimerase
VRVLLLGGTGVLSSATAREAAAREYDVSIITRGSGARQYPENCHVLNADIRNPEAMARVLLDRTWDVVVDFLAFDTTDAARDVELFLDRTGHFIFISSASVYRTRPMAIPIKESTPLGNTAWSYPLAKQATEEAFIDAHRQKGFPVTVVRPSHTYDDTAIPLLGGWTDIARMKAGKMVLVHGDGTSLRTLTHSTDFAQGLVGLFGQAAAHGEAVHITSDEVMTWNDIYETMARHAGVDSRLVHVASETIATAEPDLAGPLLGDRAHSKIFDNSKIRSLVPDYRPVVNFAEGSRRIISYFDSHPEAHLVNSRYNQLTDSLTTDLHVNR